MKNEYILRWTLKTNECQYSIYFYSLDKTTLRCHLVIAVTNSTYWAQKCVSKYLISYLDSLSLYLDPFIAWFYLCCRIKDSSRHINEVLWQIIICPLCLPGPMYLFNLLTLKKNSKTVYWYIVYKYKNNCFHNRCFSANISNTLTDKIYESVITD